MKSLFFIGVFGINDKQEHIRINNNVICSACGALTSLEIFKSYSYFHIFFIPTFRWNIKYYVRSACCGIIHLLDPNIGQQIEKGGNPEIKAEHLHQVNRYSPYKTCPTCGSRIESDYRFCPHCGNRF